jgi:Tfp pilus assembly protein PilX
MSMSRLRNDQGIALVTTIILVAVMLVMGAAILTVVNTQADQTTKDRAGESAFNLAEATLNAEAFLLGRNWPQASVAGTCKANTLSGDLTTPPTIASPSLTQQVQSILAQTYNGSGNPTASTWHVTACADPGVSAWNSTLLNGAAYDTAFTTPGPRRMWVRAEAVVNGRKAAVSGLVQAGKSPVLPANLAVVTGKLGADLTTTSGQLLTGNVVGPLLTSLVGGSGKLYDGNIGLRCSLLDTTTLGGCLNGLYKATSITTVAPLLEGNNYYDFQGSQTISNDLIAQLRQQAKTSGTYYANSGGTGGVANGASCLPAGSAGKVVFIEQVGDGTGSCILNTTGNPSATALVVGAGGVRVCSNATCATASSGGTFTGVVYALHRKAPLASGRADVQIEGGSKVVGGVFVDDNASLPSANQHGFVNVIPPAIDMSAVLNSITSSLALCKVPILGPITCSLTTLLGGTLDSLMSVLGISPATLVAAIIPQLNSSLPAIKYDANTVNAVTTMGDSALVPGTFRQVQPMY